MTTVLITGANRGIGLEAAVQFASHFDKVIITARTQEKGVVAVQAASALAGVPEERFGLQVLELDSHASVRDAVASLPSLDAVVLNAGGLLGSQLTQHGVTANFAANVLGHAVLVEGCLAAGKIRPGAKVIFSHSEASRSIWPFAGFQPFVRIYKEEIEGSLVDPPSRGTLYRSLRQRMATYANSKLIGGLWLATLAKERPDIYFASVSPGGCVTDVYDTMPFPMPQMMGSPTVGKALVALGVCHSLAAAARRYVLAVTDGGFQRRFASGSVVGGPYIRIAHPSGALVDQSEFSSYYTDVELQTEAARVVREAAKR